MLLADLMTFKVKFEPVSQHIMFLADLMTFKVKFESVSQEWIFNAKWVIYRYIMKRTSYFFNEIIRSCRLNRYFSVSSLKHQSTGRHVSPLRHGILILCFNAEKQKITSFIDCDWTRLSVIKHLSINNSQSEYCIKWILVLIGQFGIWVWILYLKVLWQ